MNARRMALRALAGLAASPLASAVEWPAATGAIVLPFSAGTAVDRLARIIAEYYGELRPSRFATLNMPGAGGTLAARHVLRGPHDGRNLLMAGSGLVQLAILSKVAVGFDPLSDLHPIGMLSELDFFVFTRADSQAESVRTLRPRRTDGKVDSLFFGANTIGGTGHVAGLLLGRQLGIPVTFVPYRDSNLAMIDTIEGRLDFGIFGWEAATPHLQAGALRALAVLADRAPPYAPLVPTLKAQGIDGMRVRPWNGLFAASATPSPVLERLEEELRLIWRTRSLDKTVTALRMTPSYRDSSEMRRFIAAETENFRRIALELGLVGAL